MHYLFGQTSTDPVDDELARRLLVEARGRREELGRVPLEQILGVLDRVGRRWADPGDELRRQVLAEAPAQIGFSLPMVTEELNGFCAALSRPGLEAKIGRELGSLVVLDDWEGGREQLFLRALPRGVVLHVASGNALTVGVLSAVEGLITKNVNLVKAASKATLMPLCFARSLAEVDDGGPVSRSLAILSWPGGRSQVHKVFQQGCDAIVVWGSQDVVQVYRSGLGLQTKLIEYGPKVSFGVIARERLDAPETARDAAAAVALWDQSACSSPQVLYVEDASPDHAPTLAFAARLEAALREVQQRLPLGPLDLQERAELTKERELAEVTEALGAGELRTPGRDPDWTIVSEWDPAFKLSPLFRTIYLKPVARLEDIPALIEPYRAYLQTAGIAAAPPRLLALAEQLFTRGLLRVTTLAEMSGGSAGEPHDGGFALQALVKWVSLDFQGRADRYDAAEWQAPEQQRALAFARLQRQVLEVAPLSPFYRAHLAGVQLRDWEDWPAVPPLTQQQLREASPPRSDAIFTDTPMGAHFLRSGGSTGEPKLSAFAYADYEADMLRAARGFYAAGLRRGDRVANLLMAGHLYGSFLSINRGLELVGCNSFPFTSAVAAADLPPLLRGFGIDVLMGLPSWLNEVFAAIRRSGEPVVIRKVYYSGEHLYPEERTRLQQEFGIELIASLGYGSVDGGPMGYQCAAGTGGVHHLHADHQYLELVDGQTLQPVPTGEPGEVLVTNLNRRLMPLIRYRIGDLARWVPEPCPCGRTTPRFELLGRCDDYLIAGSINVDYRDMVAGAMAVAGIDGTIQLVASRLDSRDLLTLRVEATNGDADLGARIQASILERNSALRRSIESGQLHPLAIEVLRPGSIERNPRTGKVRRVIDKRLG